MKCCDGAIKTAFDITVNGKCGSGCVAQDDVEATDNEGLQRVNFSAINPSDRDTWRSGVRSAMHAASQLPGRWHTDVNVAPVLAC